MVRMLRYGSVLLLSALFFQCSRMPETHYYLIDYPVIAAEENANPVHDVVLGVSRFDVEPLYDSGRLVYRESPYEGKFYHYHRWATPPGRMITDKVIEQFRASNLFKQVVAFPRFDKVDYILHGKIKAMEEWDVGEQWFAKVKITAELVERKSNNLIWQTTVERKNVVNEKSPLQVVKGINHGVQQCVEELQQEIGKLFSQLNE